MVSSLHSLTFSWRPLVEKNCTITINKLSLLYNFFKNHGVTFDFSFYSVNSFFLSRWSKDPEGIVSCETSWGWDSHNIATLTPAVGWSDFSRKNWTHVMLCQIVVGPQFQNFTLKCWFLVWRRALENFDRYPKMGKNYFCF